MSARISIYGGKAWKGYVQLYGMEESVDDKDK